MRSRSFAVVAVLAAVGASVAFALDANAAVPGAAGRLDDRLQRRLHRRGRHRPQHRRTGSTTSAPLPRRRRELGHRRGRDHDQQHRERLPGRQRPPGHQADPGRGRATGPRAGSRPSAPTSPRRPAASCGSRRRLQQPNVSGAAAAGYWPAFWTLGAAARPVGATNWPSIGEIDIMEDINGRSSRLRHPALRRRAGRPVQRDHRPRQRRARLRRLPDRLPHLRGGVDRSVSPEQIRWYLDGANYFTVNANQVDATTWNNATHHGFFVDPQRGDGRRLPGRVRRRSRPRRPSPACRCSSTTSPSTSRWRHDPPPTTPATTPPTTPPAGGTRARTARSRPRRSTRRAGTQPRRPDAGGRAGRRLDRQRRLGSSTTTSTSAPAAARLRGPGRLRRGRRRQRPGRGTRSTAVATRRSAASRSATPAAGSPGARYRATSRTCTGRHTVFLTFTSGQPADFVNVNWFQFRR